MIDVTCKQCGIIFKAHQSGVARGQHIFCGRPCYAAWKRLQPHAEPKPRKPRPKKPRAPRVPKIIEKKVKLQPHGKKCKECGGFIFDSNQKFYCSTECAKISGIKSRSVIAVCQSCGNDFFASKYDVAKGMGKYCSQRCTGHAKSRAVTTPKVHSRSNGGRRPDLNNMYFRSSWEANYARYLNWLISNNYGEIVSWEFEPKVFVFPVKRGNTSYTPDFKIIKKDGSYEWHEIKGWMDKNSQIKLNRMAKHYPQERVVLVGKHEYTAIARDVKSIIPNWETNAKHST